MPPRRPRVKLDGWTVLLFLAPLLLFGALVVPRYGASVTFTSLDWEDGFDLAFRFGTRCFLLLLLLALAGGMVHAVDLLPWHINVKAVLLAPGFLLVGTAALFLIWS